MKLKALACASIAALALAGTAAFAGETLKIGVYLPLTGSGAFGGQLELEGVKLAHAKYPKILGKDVELVVIDNKTDKVEAANAVQRLIDKEKVPVIIGSYGSSLSMAGGEVAESRKVPMVSTSATNPLVTAGKRYSFRACFIDPFQGAGAAGWAYEKMGARTAAVLQEISNDYSVGLTKFFKDAFEKLGGKVVMVSNFQTGDQDFTAQLTQIIDKKPDLLFIPNNFAEGAIIMRQARDLGGEFQMMGGDTMDVPEMSKIAGDAAEGFTFTTVAFDTDMPEMNDVAKAFTAEWHAAYPDRKPAGLTALGYDTYLIVRDAIERAGSTDPEAITEALIATKDLPCVSGATTMNENHDALKPVGVAGIRNGVRTFLGIQDIAK